MPSSLFEKRERLVVAAALEVVRELRIDRRRKLALQLDDPLGNGAQLFQMRCGVAGIKFAIGDDGTPFAQGSRERLMGRG